MVGERALQELYYPPFKAVVQRGRAGSVMGSYNRLNGTYACQHPGILGTLKQDWGWDGFVAPDFLHAVRDPVAAANAGLDLPGLGVTEGRTAEDFTSGRIPAERLDEIVRRTLFAIFDAGLDEHPSRSDQRPALASTPEHVALATRIATEGMVLLANRDGLLPLDAGQVRSVAVIGTARDDAQWVMAGSPCVRVSPDRRVTPLEGITARAGGRRARGVRAGFLGRRRARRWCRPRCSQPAGREGTGLLGEYWNGETPDGEPALTVVDPAVDIPRAPEGVSAPVWSARWTGTITPGWTGPTGSPSWPPGSAGSRSTGPWSPPGSGSSVRCSTGPPLPVSGVANLRAGQPVSIRLDYSSGTAWPVMEPGVGGANVRLGWQPPGHPHPRGRPAGRRL